MTGTNITDEGDGISEDYYKYQWLGVTAQMCWIYMFAATAYIDQSDDEMQLFFKHSYFYLVKGLCDPNFCDKIKDSRAVDHNLCK